MTRTLVIGAGSIGVRHASVLAALGHEVAVVSAREQPGLVRYATIADGTGDFAPEYVVVATETGRHAGSVSELAASGFGGLLLVEKPLAVEVDELRHFERVGVGYNLRFHPVLVRLHEVLASTTVHTVEAYAGQHLTSWRPARDLATQYSGSKARGGGVLRDLSHEFDYLGRMLGSCLGVFARGGRLTQLTDDSDDAWGIVAHYERAPVLTLQLNYLDTHTRRRVVANTALGTVEADLIAGTLRIDGASEAFEVDRDATYRAMHEAMLSGSGEVASVDEAAATDGVIAMVETSAAEERWVRA